MHGSPVVITKDGHPVLISPLRLFPAVVYSFYLQLIFVNLNFRYEYK